MDKIIVYGTGIMAQLAYYYFLSDSNYKVVAFVVSPEFFTQETFCELPVITSDTVEKKYPPKEFMCFIALSYAHINETRKEKYHMMKKKQYKLATYISSKSIIMNHNNIGENCFILEGCIIQPFATICNNVTIWSGAHIGHHSIIRNHCFIAPKVAISGCVDVGEGCFVGINATIRDNVVIGNKCVIGAGSLVLKNTISNSIYKGSPAEIVKGKNIDQIII